MFASMYSMMKGFHRHYHRWHLHCNVITFCSQIYRIISTYVFLVSVTVAYRGYYLLDCGGHLSQDPAKFLSCEIECLKRNIALKFDKRFGNSAAETPVKFEEE